MSVQGLFVPPGHGKKLTAREHEITFKVTSEWSSICSSFEVVVPPGMDVGAHTHARTEELFYVVDGQLDVFAFEPVTRDDRWETWESSDGATPVRAGPGSILFVPPGCPHAFANRTTTPVKVFHYASPPAEHEAYFDELMELLSRGGEIDPAEVARLRAQYDTQQITPAHLPR